MLLKSIAILIAVLIFFTPPGLAQNNSGETYAIVVGISKYRYIKPLSYADSDAELFTELLKSRAGGNIKQENLFLLKNDSANAGNFWSALSRVSNMNLNKGDRVYIFFAGHGDAVKNLNEYYLLLSDCQPANDGNNYLLSFGAIDMYHLKNRIGLLTARGVEVILVLDACRTNELAGGYASQVFNTSILQSKVGEIAMLATGPGEVSIEDVSFGSGHGLFTYNLVDALSGRADKEEAGNNDRLISLDELQNWVVKNVKLMAGKFKTSQVPVFCCDDRSNTTMGVVDSIFSFAWERKKQLNTSAGVINRGQAERSNDIIADTSLLSLYHQFNTARKEHKLWGDSSADSYYDRMQALFPANRITEDARYALASDFINFAQQKINLYLEGKDLLSVEILREKSDSLREPGFLSEEYDRLRKTISEKWTIAGLMIQKAGKLLSTTGDSSMLLKLKPKIYFLLSRGYLNEEKENTLSYEQAMQYAMEAYKADSAGAYTAELLALLYEYKDSYDYHLRIHPGESYSNQLIISDTALRYFNKAIMMAPQWVNPYRHIGLKVYGYGFEDSAMVYMRKAISINPMDANTHIMYADLLRYYDWDSCIYHYRRALMLAPSSARSEIYRKIGRAFLAAPKSMGVFDPKNINPVIFNLRMDSVEWYSRKALSLDPYNKDAYKTLSTLYSRRKKPDSELQLYLKMISIFPDYDFPYMRLEEFYTERRKPDSVFYFSKKLLEADSQSGYALFQIAKYYDEKASNDSAFVYYNKALKSGYANIVCRERLGYIIMGRDKTSSLPLYYFNLNIKLTQPQPGWRPYYHIACYYANRGDLDKSIEYLEMVLARGMRNKRMIDEDPFLASIRGTDAFKKLMVKYRLE
jgi:caspase domain-containing protein/tetratricopeptide repeat protein